jgi:hydroxymethylglutaryl-CoA lyase
MSDQVRIIEMGPRDGLQNEKTPVSIEARIAFVEALVAAGLHTVEVGAFVSPKAIPQMASSDAVLRGVSHVKDAEFHVLVPNEKGYEAARAAGAKVVSVFAAASEGFSRANINCTVAESIERFKPVFARAKADGVKVRGYVSCVLGCPFDGEIKPKAVADLAKTLWDLGCYEISLGDTIGVGTPLKAKDMLRAVGANVPATNLAMHFHDTYGQALANLYAGMEERAAAHSIPPPAVSAAVPTPPVRPAMSRRRMSSTCWRAWGSGQAWIWRSCWRRRTKSAVSSGGRRSAAWRRR